MTGEVDAALPRDLEGVKTAVIDFVNQGNVDGLFALLAPSMQAAFPRDTWPGFLERVRDAKGRITASVPVAGSEGVWELQAERGRWRLDIGLGGDHKVTRFVIREVLPSDAVEPPVARSEVPLALPVRGVWFVFRLHADGERGKAPPPDQRRAVDLLVLDANDKSYRGDGKRNADYYAWGKEVLAAADGKVVIVVDGVPENEPPNMNPYFVPGNLVVVEHSAKLFSEYAHLQPKSLRVHVGDRVRRGQVLGLCGNSGNSSEPHLHFQMQDGQRADQSLGVEPVFSDVRVARDGKASVEREYLFKKGDRIENAASR